MGQENREQVKLFVTTILKPRIQQLKSKIQSSCGESQERALHCQLGKCRIMQMDWSTLFNPTTLLKEVPVGDVSPALSEHYTQICCGSNKDLCSQFIQRELEQIDGLAGDATDVKSRVCQFLERYASSQENESKPMVKGIVHKDFSQSYTAQEDDELPLYGDLQAEAAEVQQQQKHVARRAALQEEVFSKALLQQQRLESAVTIQALVRGHTAYKLFMQRKASILMHAVPLLKEPTTKLEHFLAATQARAPSSVRVDA